MVRALGSASPRECAGAGSDSGLGEEQPDLQESLLPRHLTPANTDHFDDKEKDDSESSVTETLLPDFSCLAVGTSQPPKSEEYRQQKAQNVISEKAKDHTVTAGSLARSGPPTPCAPRLSALLIALAKQNLRLLDSLKQSNLVLNKLERDASCFEVSESKF